MDEILLEVEKLKDKILDSKEYKLFIESRDKLDNNKDINEIIEKIKSEQKKLINKEDKNEDTTLEEIKLKSLYSELNNFDDYNTYIENARILNDLITNIQKRFEEYFSSLIM